jgi:hypothetical protein
LRAEKKWFFPKGMHWILHCAGDFSRSTRVKANDLVWVETNAAEFRIDDRPHAEHLTFTRIDRIDDRVAFYASSRCPRNLV